LKALTRMPSGREELVDLALKKLALQRMSFSGLGTMAGGPRGGVAQNGRYKVDARWTPELILDEIDCIHTTFTGMDVRITNLDFADLIRDTTQHSVLYLDPPYYGPGNALYQCGFTEFDHRRLSALLRSTTHDWVLSYDDCAEVRSLYNWAEIEPVRVRYSVSTIAKKTCELLIFPRGRSLAVGKLQIAA
jgi:DNA adenine methylase